MTHLLVVSFGEWVSSDGPHCRDRKVDGTVPVLVDNEVDLS